MKLYIAIITLALTGCALTNTQDKTVEQKTTPVTVTEKVIETINNESISLTVLTNPSNSKVRIMNIKPKYYPGMELTKGKYDVFVTKLGFKPKRMWVNITKATVIHATLTEEISNDESSMKII